MYSDFLRRLSEEVVSQPEAVKAFARMAVRSLNKPFRENRPLGVLLLAGPAGSGRRHITETAARLLLGDDKRMIRMNPSFTSTVAAFAQQLWAACALFDASGPPGRPALRIVLVEGMERADAALLELLVHIFHNGELSIVTGQTMDFRRTLFVLETGVAEAEIDDLATGVHGFDATDRDIEARADSWIREMVESKIYAGFPVRFLSLIDEIVCFRKLRKPDLPFILDKMLDRLRKKLESMGLDLHVDDAAREFLLGEGDRTLRFGARGLRAATERYLDTALLDFLARRPLRSGEVVYVRRSLDGLALFVPVAGS